MHKFFDKTRYFFHFSYFFRGLGGLHFVQIHQHQAALQRGGQHGVDLARCWLVGFGGCCHIIPPISLSPISKGATHLDTPLPKHIEQDSKNLHQQTSSLSCATMASFCHWLHTALNSARACGSASKISSNSIRSLITEKSISHPLRMSTPFL